MELKMSKYYFKYSFLLLQGFIVQICFYKYNFFNLLLFTKSNSIIKISPMTYFDYVKKRSLEVAN